MYQVTFDKLCHKLDIIGELRPTKHMLINEEVTLFVDILGHHVKINRGIQFKFGRLGKLLVDTLNLC